MLALEAELQHLSEKSDHFHFMPEEMEFGGEVPVRKRAYRDGDELIEWGKVLFRPDHWDRQYFPHVFDGDDAASEDGSSRKE